MSHNSFTPLPRQSALHSCAPPDQRDRTNAEMARSLREYRRYRSQADLPALKLEPDWGGYRADLADPVYLVPAFIVRPSLNRHYFELWWQAHIEIETPGSRWHPPESDAIALCSSRSLVETVFAARAVIQLEALQRHIGDDQLAELHRQSA
jgi:hypothetical protein